MSGASHPRGALEHGLAALVIGGLFGVGLGLGGMTDARVVLGFLDLGALPSGGWDPRLLFVMGGGLVVSALGFWIAKGRGRTLLGGALRLPAVRDLDARLIGGATLFGIGWGFAGYCPGPALAALALNPREALLFVPALVVGAWLARLSASSPA